MSPPRRWGLIGSVSYGRDAPSDRAQGEALSGQRVEPADDAATVAVSIDAEP